ncbi:hypothetical protein E4U30_004858 [Claviceps sp. LM220 group G6]|nr:hypothetical protein E4U30_004858 [Claviceps sp. LM220 group G6]
MSEFPGNEARRVSTPSTDEETAAGTPRGFVSTFTPPATTLDGVSSSTMHSRCERTKPNHRYQRSSVSPPLREWWDLMPTPALRTREQQPSVPRDFEFVIPENLRSSPIFPVNIRHKGGGAELCHGRRSI